MEILSDIKESTRISKLLVEGSLYSASNKRISNYSKEERIVKTCDNKEFYTSGQNFTQFDLAFTLAYKKAIASQKKVEDVTVTLSELVKLLGRTEGGKTRGLIIDSAKRHLENRVGFEYEETKGFYGCRYKSIIEDVQNHFKISANIDYLYAAYDESCEINIDKFLSLSLGLQSWLYGFFCSSPETEVIDLDTLHAISGSNYKNSNDFKKILKQALYALEKRDIIEWRHGVTRDGIVFWKCKNLF